MISVGRNNYGHPAPETLARLRHHRVPVWRTDQDGDITIEPQNGNRVRVTFPLRYEVRNGAKHSSGKIDKTLILEPAGDDLQIVAVSERKAK